MQTQLGLLCLLLVLLLLLLLLQLVAGCSVLLCFLGCILGVSWLCLNYFGVMLRHLGMLAHLGPPGGCCCCCCSSRRCCRWQLAAAGLLLSCSCAASVPAFAYSGACSGHFRGIWEHLGAILGACWGILALPAHLSPSWSSGWAKIVLLGTF